MIELTPNQVVAQNLRRARELRSWTQEEAAKYLEPFLGKLWSKATFSQAERSVDSSRIRSFTADQVVAFSQAFFLPIDWFFTPVAEVPTQHVVVAADFGHCGVPLSNLGMEGREVEPQPCGRPTDWLVMDLKLLACNTHVGTAMRTRKGTNG